MGPWLGTLQDRSVRVRMGIGDHGLARQGRPVAAMLDCGVLGKRPANPAGFDGPVVAGGPVGPCGTLSPLFHDALGPLEHSVLDHAGPVGRHVAVSPVGPDKALQVLDHADLACQRADVGPVTFRTVGAFGSECSLKRLV